MMNTYDNTPVEIRYDSGVMDYVHSFPRYSNEITNNDNMFYAVIMCMRLIMPDDTGSIMNIMRMNTGMFCDMAH